MAFLTPEELQTHLYKENIETIAREDDAIVAAAIDAAIEEASGYLGAYDRKKIFGTEGDERNALLYFTSRTSPYGTSSTCAMQERISSSGRIDTNGPSPG